MTEAAGKADARTVLTDPVHLLAFGFGTGLAPKAPGTVGSLPGVALAWLTLPFALEWRIGVLVLLISGLWLGLSAKHLRRSTSLTVAAGAAVFVLLLV